MRQVNERKILVLSAGDPSAIGIELIINIWQQRRLNKVPAFFVIGDRNIFKARHSLLKASSATKYQQEKDALPIFSLSKGDIDRADFASLISEIFREALPILSLSNRQIDSPGRFHPQNAASIIESIALGVELVIRNKAAALVTAPIMKKGLAEGGFAFPGHTEYLSHLAQKFYKRHYHPVMMLANRYLRAIALTTHIPLLEVARYLNKELIIKTAHIIYSDLQKRFNIPAPHLAITGLNPHAGEDGLLGDQEERIIKPAILQLQEEGLNVSGPHAADSLFQSQMRSQYDAVLAMYHDQALIPVKALDFANSVNVTLGLPFIRTSPAHGTAYQLVGSNQASPQSLLAALNMARELAS